jgi:hypothetical protein
MCPLTLPQIHVMVTQLLNSVSENGFSKMGVKSLERICSSSVGNSAPRSWGGGTSNRWCVMEDIEAMAHSCKELMLLSQSLFSGVWTVIKQTNKQTRLVPEFLWLPVLSAYFFCMHFCHHDATQHVVTHTRRLPPEAKQWSHMILKF